MQAMAVAVVGQPSRIYVVLAGIGCGCNGLGRIVPRPTGSTYGWTTVVVIVAGWMGLISDSRKSAQVPMVTDWAWQSPGPWTVFSWALGWGDPGWADLSLSPW